MSITGSLKYLWDFFDVVRQTHQNKATLTALQEEVDGLTLAVERLTLKAEHAREVERLEREKLALQLQSILSQFENRLPPSLK